MPSSWGAFAPKRVRWGRFRLLTRLGTDLAASPSLTERGRPLLIGAFPVSPLLRSLVAVRSVAATKGSAERGHAIARVPRSVSLGPVINRGSRSVLHLFACHQRKIFRPLPVVSRPLPLSFSPRLSLFPARGVDLT